MVTADEIAQVTVFAALSRPTASGCVASQPTSALARASTQRTRATSERSSACSRAASRRSSSSTGSSASSASVSRETSSGRCRSRSERCSPWVSGCGGVARDAHRAARLPRCRVRGAGYREGSGPPGEPSDRRPRRLAGPRGRASSASGDRARPALGRFLRGAEALPRPQPDHVQVAPAGCAGRRRAVVGSVAGRGRLPRDSRRERQDCRATATSPGRRAARGRDRAGCRGVRHGDRRRGARRAGRGRVRSVGGSATIVVEREAPVARRVRRPGSRTTSASRLVCPATSSRTGRSSRRAGSAPRFWSRERSRGSMPRRTTCTSTAATSCGRGRSSSPAEYRGAACRSRDSTGSPGRASSTAQRAARRRTPTVSTSTSSVPATRRARQRCSSRPTRGA